MNIELIIFICITILFTELFYWTIGRKNDPIKDYCFFINKLGSILVGVILSFITFLLYKLYELVKEMIDTEILNNFLIIIGIIISLFFINWLVEYFIKKYKKW